MNAMRHEATSQRGAKADTGQHADLCLPPRRFIVIRHLKSRGEAAARMPGKFVEELKALGFIADALRRHSVEDASVAPAATI